MILFLQELGLLRTERAHLEVLCQDHKHFNEVMTELSSSSQDRLSQESERIVKAQADVVDREKSLYKLYKQEEKTILDKKENAQNEIEERRKQLEADKIYLQECQDVFKQSAERANGGSDADRARLQREKLALESETARMAREEKTLDYMESSQSLEMEAALKQLQETRSGQIDDLNKDKNNVKTMLEQWRSSVRDLSEQCQKQLVDCAEGHQHKQDLSRVQSEFQIQKNIVDSTQSDLAESEKRLEEKERRRSVDLDCAKETIEMRLNEINGQLQQQMGCIQHRKQL